MESMTVSMVVVVVSSPVDDFDSVPDADRLAVDAADGRSWVPGTTLESLSVLECKESMAMAVSGILGDLEC